ncbi:MAG: 4Fe-4S dicluster domain-containing protein [bacterium]|nr:4Fe-4S dicluster domain-containing protein [bacterium]
MAITNLDPNFKHEVAKEAGAEGIRFCFSCGTCTAACPVREIESSYSPRKFIRMILLGMREEVLSSEFIWLCSTCYSCEERCPQGVSFAEIVTAVKNIAAREGRLHPAYKTQLNLLSQFGRLYELEELDNKKRKKIGLDSLKTNEPEVGKLLKNEEIEKGDK